MAYYRTCPRCGCTLDPGERCDCAEKVRRREYKTGTRTEKGTGQMTFVFRQTIRDGYRSGA